MIISYYNLTSSSFITLFGSSPFVDLTKSTAQVIVFKRMKVKFHQTSANRSHDSSDARKRRMASRSACMTWPEVINS